MPALTGLVQADYLRAMDLHNRHVTDDDANLLIADAMRENESDSSGWGCCRSDGTIGSQELRDIFERNKESFDPGARTKIENFLNRQRLGNRPSAIEDNGPMKTLLKAHAKHTTWHCDWFPTTLRPSNPQASLFSPGGVCDKYDQATGKASRTFELANHQTTNIAWAGHCDMASRVCALLNKPVRNVVYNGVTFTPHDIQGLLVMVSNDIAGNNEPFLGARYNGNPGDDPSEPYPHILLPAVKQHLEDGRVVVLDITNSGEVWNYPFDQAVIEEFSSPQPGMRKVQPTNDGVIKYQSWNLKGTEYAAEDRFYRSWIEYGTRGEKLASGWFGDPRDAKRNPDFMWVPTACGDLSKRDNWPATCSYNPQVDPRTVYDIYMQSI
jgi:hypothetical protein